MDGSSRYGKEIYKSFIIKMKFIKEEEKYEIEVDVIFNKKGKYKFSISFGKVNTLIYFIECQQDSDPELKFKEEELQQELFYKSLISNYIYYTNHDCAYFIAKNEEIFSFQKVFNSMINPIEMKLFLLESDSNVKKEIKDSITISPRKNVDKIDIRVIFNFKGKYELQILFTGSIKIIYYPICEKDANPKIELSNEEIKAVEFYNNIKNYGLEEISHLSPSFIAKNEEKFIFDTYEIKSAKLIGPDNEEKNLEYQKPKERVIEFNVKFWIKGKYHLIFEFKSFNNFVLEYFPIVE